MSPRHRLAGRLAPRLAACALAGLLCAGCGVGLVYTHITVPLDTNAEGEPLQAAHGSGSVDQLSLGGARVVWNENGLAATARENGFTKIYYADLEILSVFGIWRQEWAIIYGERGTPQP